MGSVAHPERPVPGGRQPDTCADHPRAAWYSQGQARPPRPRHTGEVTRTDTRRTGDLGEFLRSRRARLTPEDVGLASYGARRVPGLRPEYAGALDERGPE